MSLASRIARRFDVVIVGARPAGAATALLLARQGRRVLVVDPAAAGSDTVSTHALMRGGVAQLARWGLLEGIVEAGTPAIRTTRFDYEDGALDVAIEPRDGVDALRAPRRTLLDAVLARAAAAAGAQVEHGVRVAALLRAADGRVTGVRLADAGGGEIDVAAGRVIGADGVRSLVARETGASVTRTGRHAAGVIYGYWPGLHLEGSRWYFRPGESAGAIPTNDGHTCLFVAMPAARLRDERAGGLAAPFARVFAAAAPDLAPAVAMEARAGELRAFGGIPGYLRRPFGPGWALVGDAGFFRDPITAHGITDALRDATLLARALADGGEAALREYESRRDDIAVEMLDLSDAVAGFEWSAERVRDLHHRLSKLMSRETRMLKALAEEPLGPRESISPLMPPAAAIVPEVRPAV